MDKDYQTEVPDPTDENIRKIGNYTFNRRICIGQGSFGKVFKGADLLTGQKVAIKRIELRGFEHDTHFVSKILKEVRIMRQLNGHPNIVRLLDFIKGKAYYYLILELCQRGSLQSLMEDGRCGEGLALQVVREMVQAFLCLESHQVIHNDLNPTNILCSQDGKFKLSDFSIATQCSLFGEEEGNFLYKSPQKLKESTFSSKCDVWSLGVIFYEMLIGEIPWRAADPDSQYLAILTTKITIKKSFICELSQQLITKTLAVPEKKRASWAELADLLSLDKSLASTFVSSARDDELILFRQLSEFVIAQLLVEKQKLKTSSHFLAVFQLVSRFADGDLNSGKAEQSQVLRLAEEKGQTAGFAMELLVELMVQKRRLEEGSTVQVFCKRQSEQYWPRIKLRLKQLQSE